MFHEKWFAASSLIKQSASQIKYFRDKRLQIYNDRIMRGVEFQHKVAEEIEGAAEEFRSTVDIDGYVVFACHDIVTDDAIIEVKNVDGEYENWYLESSLLQTALYKALLIKSGGHIVTPKFRLNEGYKKQMKRVPVDIRYLLHFGDRRFEITDVDADAIIKYFIEKAKHTFDYDNAKAYDKKHKFKHYDECKELFHYLEIDNTGNQIQKNKSNNNEHTFKNQFKTTE